MTDDACPCPPCLAARSFDLGYDREPCEHAAAPLILRPLVRSNSSGDYLTDEGITALELALAECRNRILDPIRILAGILGRDVTDGDLRSDAVRTACLYLVECADCGDCPEDEECSACRDWALPRVRDERGRVVCPRCTQEPEDTEMCPHCGQELGRGADVRTDRRAA